MQCLDIVEGLDLTASGGDNVLWMVAPVLRAAFMKLQDAGAEREQLEDEVVQHRLLAEQACMAVEHEREWLRRAAEGQGLRCKERREAAWRLEGEAERLEAELKTILGESAGLKQEADEGLAAEQARWERERQKLEADTDGLRQQLGELEDPVPLEEQAVKAEAEIARMAAERVLLQPEMNKDTALSKRAHEVEMHIGDLQEEILQLEQAALERRNRKAKARKKR